MAQYEIVRDLGVGDVGIVKLVREEATDQLFVIKFIERGIIINESIEQEILDHRLLSHPNIIRFKEVFLNERYLCIVMEYAAGGELYNNILSGGRLTEDLARCLFRQLIAAVSYIHSADVCHWNLKPESTLLDRPLYNGHQAPRLKICDFVTSQSLPFHWHRRVRTPTYSAPEIVGGTYDRKMVDVWACGVALYVMLVGSYPFGGAVFSETIENIKNARFSFPDHIPLSMESKNLISRILVADPENRITISGIRNHSWYLHKLENDIGEGEDVSSSYPLQSVEDILRLVDDAKRLSERPLFAGIPIEGSTSYNGETSGYEDEEASDDDGESEVEDRLSSEFEDEDGISDKSGDL